MNSSRKVTKFVTPTNQNGDKGISTLSKKRYFEMEERVKMILGGKLQEEAGMVMKAMREIMKFDPNVSRYSEEVREVLEENSRKWRQRNKDEKNAVRLNYGLEVL
jgi:hypothetical protein